MKTPNEMRTEILKKASEDETFRAALIADPKKAVAAELGVEMPDNFSISVHQESAESAHLILPPSSKLQESDLQAVTGGEEVWKAAFPSTW